MENAVVTEIYGKHDRRPAFLLSNQRARFIKAKSSVSKDTESLVPGDRMK